MVYVSQLTFISFGGMINGSQALFPSRILPIRRSPVSLKNSPTATAKVIPHERGYEIYRNGRVRCIGRKKNTQMSLIPHAPNSDTSMIWKLLPSPLTAPPVTSSREQKM